MACAGCESLLEILAEVQTELSRLKVAHGALEGEMTRRLERLAGEVSACQESLKVLLDLLRRMVR